MQKVKLNKANNYYYKKNNNKTIGYTKLSTNSCHKIGTTVNPRTESDKIGCIR